MDVEETVTIDAPIDTVFDVLMDVESWPAWTTTMKKLRRLTPGELAVGSRVRISQPYMTPHTWTITELVRPTTFTWETHQFGVHLTARHDLSDANGHTTGRIGVDIGGALGRLIMKLALARTQHFVKTEATGLTERAASR